MSGSLCNRMKKAAIISSILFALGVVLEITAQMLSLGSIIPAYVSYLGFFAIFSSLLVMLVTIISILLPQVRKQLETCQH